MTRRNQTLALAVALLSITAVVVVLVARRATPPPSAEAALVREDVATPAGRERAPAKEPLAEPKILPPEPPREVEAPSAGESNDPPAVRAEEGGAVALEPAVQWLRGALAEKYGELTTAQAALLSDLDLQGASITDEDLRHLVAFPALRILTLHGTAITDAGVSHLRALRELQSLDLRGTQVSGLCLSDLPTWRLEALHLTETRIAGADLLRLPPMPHLNKLKLNALAVDDAALETLGAFPSLRHLELDRTGITDEGLRRLLALNPALTRIELRGTAVTQEARQELAVAYPGCELVLDTERPGRPEDQ